MFSISFITDRWLFAPCSNLRRWDGKEFWSTVSHTWQLLFGIT